MSEIASEEPGPATQDFGAGGPHLHPREWLLLLVLAAVQFNHIVDFMIIMPLGPVYIKEMGLTMAQFSWVVAAYTISAAVANVLAAFCIDRFDRKNALLCCFAGFTGGTLVCAIAPDYPVLLIARIVAGAFGGVAAGLVMAIIGDAFHDARRGTATGVVMSAFSIASIAGLPAGLLLADAFGWHAPFASLAVVSAAVLVMAVFVMPSLRGHLRDAPPAASAWEATTNRLGAMAELLLDPNHLAAFALMVAMMFTSFLIGPYVATFLVDNVGMAQDELKYIYLCGGLATILTTTPIGWLSDRFGKLMMFRLAAGLAMVPVVLLTIFPRGTALWIVLTVTTLQMITMSGRMVPAMALINRCASPGQRGGFMSLNTAVQHLSAGLATAAGGLVVTQPAAGQPLEGFALVGLLSCVATVACLFLAGRLRAAPAGELAPDTLAGPASSRLGAAPDLGEADSDESPAVGQVPAFEEG
jgi:predicted MFS family arabinose efflux permease